MSARVGRYKPSDVPPEVWFRIRPLVAKAAECAAKTPYDAVNLASATAQLAWWADREGLPARAEVVFHPDTIDHYIAVGCTHLAEGTRLNYQSQLRRVGTILVGPPLYRPRHLPQRASDPVAPYTSDDIGALLVWSRGLPTERLRTNTAVLLAFGLGAGLTSREINSLVGTDVVCDDDGVIVRVGGGSPRTVPVLARWESEVANQATRAGLLPVFLSARTRPGRKDVSRLIEDCPTLDAPKLNTQRLRATWIVCHLEAGTPLQLLEEAAGVSAAQLASWVRYLPAVDEGAGRRILRDP